MYSFLTLVRERKRKGNKLVRLSIVLTTIVNKLTKKTE